MGIYRQGAVSIDSYLLSWIRSSLVVGTGASLPASGDLGQLFWRTSDSKLYRMTADAWEVVANDAPLFDFDAHAQPNAFPPSDFVGQRGYMIEADSNSWTVSVMIGLSIFTDTALYRHRQVMDSLFDSFKPLTRIPLINLSTGAATGNSLIVRGGVQVMPMAKSDVRGIQFIMIECETDGSFAAVS
jgi:hypothetical protein